MYIIEEYCYIMIYIYIYIYIYDNLIATLREQNTRDITYRVAQLEGK